MALKDQRSRLLAIAVLLLAFALRAASLVAGKPYITYVDEGNFLQPVANLLREGGWDPHWYKYPQLPLIVVTAAMRLYAPVYGVIHKQSMREGLSDGQDVYDVLEPFELLVMGRALSLLASLGIVVLTGLFAYRLGGPLAGLGAALLAALTPALAIRGAIASVDAYAAFFVLACLVSTDMTRTSRRPGLASLTAGAMAGFAFASKYPAVLVLAAFGVTTLLESIGWREKLRRTALAVLGLFAGAILAMPALVSHLGDVSDAIHRQAVLYAHMRSPSLWRQAVARAEWDLPYERGEMGFVYVALTAVGLGFALRDRRLAPAIWGWIAFAASCLVLYGRQVFQPFRNLLPLMPLACIAVALLLVRVRRWFRRPSWADALALFGVLTVLGVPLVGYARARLLLVDSRTETMDWLVANTRGGDDVLFLRELGFLKQELARLPARPTVRWWEEARPAISELKPRFLVAGVLQRSEGSSVDIAALPEVKASYTVLLRVGEQPTVSISWWFHGNRQIIYTLERMPNISSHNRSGRP
jgi:4-amino-4-deoxy-L-arabinose transferase-like glycosyltransferase